MFSNVGSVTVHEESREAVAAIRHEATGKAGLSDPEVDVAKNARSRILRLTSI